jgi:hypothetical protein
MIHLDGNAIRYFSGGFLAGDGQSESYHCFRIAYTAK